MQTLTINKNNLLTFIEDFIKKIESDKVKIEFDETHLLINKEDETCVFDELISKAADLGPEDLSINVDHYLYNLPKSETK